MKIIYNSISEMDGRVVIVTFGNLGECLNLIALKDEVFAKNALCVPSEGGIELNIYDTKRSRPGDSTRIEDSKKFKVEESEKVTTH